MATVKIHFLPDDVTILAKAGESWLDVADRAGVQISTGCLAGACHACTIEISGGTPEDTPEDTPEGKLEGKPASGESVLACLQAVPEGFKHIEVDLLDDPTW